MLGETMERDTAQRLGFMVPLVLFVLFFVICCGVISGVFLRAAAESARAEEYNTAVQLCRNQAEICRADRTSGEPLRRLYFDKDFQPAEPETAVCCLVVERFADAWGAGTLRRDVITACRPDGSEIYSLEAAVYLPEGR